MTEYRSLKWEDVREGDELPTLTRDVSTTTVISAAIASRDFYPVHHDFRFAQGAGARDIFLNIISTGGFVGKYLTDWSGPEGEIKRMKFHLGVPCCAGDMLKMTGRVTEKREDAGERLVDIDYDLAVADGSHCRGTATMILPASVAEPSQRSHDGAT